MIVSAAAHPKTPSPTCATPRPPVDWWEVAGERYRSTSDLVDNFSPSADGSAGEYHWRDRAAFGWKDGLVAASPGLGKGAVLGGLAGVCLSGAVNVVAFLMAMEGVRNPFGLSEFLSVPGWGVGGLLLGGGGGALNSFQAARSEFEQGHVVPGVILEKPESNGPRMHFYVGGHVQKDVDLNDYALAQPGPIPPGTTPWWAA
ncbi:MAG: hypothetical protein HY319_17490 [Armatimonadetes bacterium]|nr:hypothetical protein [Armatimonadota bacterium]